MGKLYSRISQTEGNQKNGILNIRAIKRDVEKEVENYQIRCDTIDNTLRELSGGNQQKLIVARALSHEPKVIIAAQPTRGVDIGAIEYIHQKLMEFRNQGNAILLISADLDEVVKLSDRIAVIYGGRIVATRPTGMFTEAQLGSYMLGNAESAGGGGVDEAEKINTGTKKKSECSLALSCWLC